MTIEEARGELARLAGKKFMDLTPEDHASLGEIQNLVWQHLDGRGVLSGEPFLKGMQPLATSAEIKGER